MRCLICNGPHRAVECPQRGQSSASGSGMAAAADQQLQGQLQGFVMSMALGAATGLLFVAEDIFGYAIVDSGATRSMTSNKQMQWLQDFLFSLMNEDVLRSRESAARFYFAGGGGPSTTQRAVGVPLYLGLEGDDGCIWFSMMDSPMSPTLLGLDWIESSGFMVDTIDGYLRHKYTGETVELDRLPTGHWGLSFLES